MTKIELLVTEIQSLRPLSIRDNVKTRLDKTLYRYMEKLTYTSERVLSKGRKDIVMKELSK